MSLISSNYFGRSISPFSAPNLEDRIPWWEIIGAVVFVIGATWFAFNCAEPTLSFPWLVYVVMLVPVIGIVEIGLEVAPLYYLPQIGLFIAIIWGACDFTVNSASNRRVSKRRVMIILISLPPARGNRRVTGGTVTRCGRIPWQSQRTTMWRTRITVCS